MRRFISTIHERQCFRHKTTIVRWKRRRKFESLWFPLKLVIPNGVDREIVSIFKEKSWPEWPEYGWRGSETDSIESTQAAKGSASCRSRAVRNSDSNVFICNPSRCQEYVLLLFLHAVSSNKEGLVTYMNYMKRRCVAAIELHVVSTMIRPYKHEWASGTPWHSFSSFLCLFT